MKRTVIFSISLVLGCLLSVSIGSMTTSGQTNTPRQKGCVEFTNPQVAAMRDAPKEDLKFRVRKYLWSRWKANKRTCADLIRYTPKGVRYKWVHPISFDGTPYPLSSRSLPSTHLC